MSPLLARRLRALLSSTILSRSPICVPLLANTSAASLPRTPVCERTCPRAGRGVGTLLVSARLYVTDSPLVCYLPRHPPKGTKHMGRLEGVRGSNSAAYSPLSHLRRHEIRLYSMIHTPLFTPNTDMSDHSGWCPHAPTVPLSEWSASWVTFPR